MGDMWRSQHMQLVQMIVQNDAAHTVVNKLGTAGLFQFRDLNAGTSFYKRSFVEEVRKCDELSRVLRVIGEEFENSTVMLADKDDQMSLSLTLEDVAPKIASIDEELFDLKQQQEVSQPAPPPPKPAPPAPECAHSMSVLSSCFCTAPSSYS